MRFLTFDEQVEVFRAAWERIVSGPGPGPILIRVLVVSAAGYMVLWLVRFGLSCVPVPGTEGLD